MPAVEFGVALDHLEAGAEGVRATLSDGLVHADYVIGADGVHSTVRDRLGTDVHWMKYPRVLARRCQNGGMSKLGVLGRVAGWSCVGIGVAQLAGGVRAEPGMRAEATVDSHVRFMGSAFIGYGLGWVEAASGTPDMRRMRALAGLMALGGASRLLTRATIGRPHRFHDVLLGVELAAPVVVEVLGRADRPTR